jgi:hypothetical protein
MEYLKGASTGSAPTLLANMGLGWKGLPGTNTLAYYKKIVNNERKNIL